MTSARVEAQVEAHVERTRSVSSPELLADRMRQVSEAWRSQDEHAVREELRRLSHEAGLLASMDTLPLRDGLGQRQRVAIEADTRAR